MKELEQDLALKRKYLAEMQRRQLRDEFQRESEHISKLLARREEQKRKHHIQRLLNGNNPNNSNNPPSSPTGRNYGVMNINSL